MKKTAFSKMLAVLLSAMMVLGTLAAIPAAAVTEYKCPGNTTHSLGNCDAKAIYTHNPKYACQDAYTNYQCKECSTVFKVVDKFAEDHKWVESDKATVKPTCTTLGKDFTEVCSVCGEDKFDYIGWLGYTENGSAGLDGVLGTLDDKQGTHEVVRSDPKDGVVTLTCERCDWTDEIILNCDRMTDNGTHIWVSDDESDYNSAIELTFDDKGNAVYECACGRTETIKVHNHDLEFVPYKPATCTEDGVRSHWECKTADCPNKYFMTFGVSVTNAFNTVHDFVWDECLTEEAMALDPYKTMEIFGVNILVPVENAKASVVLPKTGHYFPYTNADQDNMTADEKKYELPVPGVRDGENEKPVYPGIDGHRREPAYTQIEDVSKLKTGCNSYVITNEEDCTVKFFCEDCDKVVEEVHHTKIYDEYIETTCDDAGKWIWSCADGDCKINDEHTEFEEAATGHIVYKGTAFEVGVGTGKEAWELFKANRYYFENLTTNAWVYSGPATTEKAETLTWYCEKGEYCTAEDGKHIYTVNPKLTVVCAHASEKVDYKYDATDKKCYVITKCAAEGCTYVFSKVVAPTEIDLTNGTIDTQDDTTWEDYLEGTYPHNFEGVTKEANGSHTAKGCADKTYDTYKCKDCGLLVKVVTYIQPHKAATCTIDNCTHQDCVSVQGKAPTCEDDGYKAVHLCSECDEWYVITDPADAGILAPAVKDHEDYDADDMKIPALKHTFEREGAEGTASGIFAAVESTCNSTGTKAYKECLDANCSYKAAHGITYLVDADGKVVENATERLELKAAVANLHDASNLVFVPGVVATCTSGDTGMVAHYHCTKCFKNFAVGTDGEVGAEITTVKEIINGVTNVGVKLDEINHYFNTYFLTKHVEDVQCNGVVDKDSESNHNYTALQYLCGCEAIYVFDHEYHVHDDSAIDKDRELLDRKVLPTCERVGYDFFYSTKCDAIIKVEVAALGHINSDDDVFTSGCNDKEENRICVRENCDGHGPVTEEGTEVGNTFHGWEPFVQAPSCTEDGLTGLVCRLCKNTMNLEVVPALGHNLVIDEDVDFVAPTDKAAGMAVYECTRCDYTERDDNVTGLKYDIAIDNASKSGAGFTDGSIVNVTVSVKGLPKTDVRALSFGIYYNPAIMTFLGENTNFVTTKFTAGQRAVAQKNDAGEMSGWVNVFAMAPNKADATSQDVTVEAAEEVVVLQFRINQKYAENASGPFANSVIFAIDGGNAFEAYEYGAIDSDSKRIYVESAETFYDLMDRFEQFMNDNDSDLDENEWWAQYANWMVILEAAFDNMTGVATAEIVPFLEINKDGSIDFVDLTHMYQMIVGELDRTYDVAFDLDRNGVVEFVDLSLLADYIMGNKSYYEVAGYEAPVDEEADLGYLVVLPDGTVLQLLTDGTWVPVQNAD